MAPTFPLDLEPALYAPARSFAERELGRTYAKGITARGEKLATGGAVDGRLDSDELTATVHDRGDACRVHLTLPLFGGVSRAQCSCMQNRTPEGEPRCPHVVAVLRVLLEGLEKRATDVARRDDPDDLFAALEDFASLGEDPLAMSDARLVWRIDDALTITPHLQTRAAVGWTRGRRVPWHELVASPSLWLSPADHLAAARVRPKRGGQEDDFEIDAFGLLEDLAGHPLVFGAEGDEPLAIREGTIGLAVRTTDEGIVVQSHIDGVSPLGRWIFDGRGFATLVAAPRRLLFTRANRATTDFLHRLAHTARPVPMAQKERLLSFMVRLEQKLAVAVADTLVDPALHPASDLLFIRLTPTQPSGVKAELLVRPAPSGGYFPAGMGPDTVLDVAELTHPRNVVRDLEREAERARDCAETLGFGPVSVVAGHVFYVRSDDDALDLVAKLSAVAAQRDWVVEWPKYAQKTLETAEPLAAQTFDLKIGEGRDWFDLEGTVNVGGQLLQLAELIQAIKKKLRYVQLKDGRWARVTALFQQRLEKLTAIIEQDPAKSKLQISAASIPELASWDPEAEGVLVVEASAAWTALHDSYKKARLREYPLPRNFRATMRPYQLVGYQWMCRLAEWGMGACLADDMGLGKTIQTLAVLAQRADEGPALIIAPTSVATNWEREAKRFAPELTPLLYRDADREAILADLKPGDLVICSYGIAQRDAERLAKIPWPTLILDEAQAVKNFQTKTAQAVRTIPAEWRLALTGTPIENGLSELWSIFRIVAPGMLGSWESFKRSYALPIEKWGMEAARRALETRLKPFILRRLKEDHLSELPSKTEIDLGVELGESERRLYDAVRVSALRDLQIRKEKAEEKGEEDDQRLAVLAALTKLRQIACHPRLFDPDWAGASAKLTAFSEIARSLLLGGHRALVFSQFTSHLKLLGEALDAIGATWLYLDGSVPAKKRAELVEEFQASGADFFLISVKAGGTGLNLTAADYVLHMDPWWNPAVEDQATDRAHRMGQTRPLTVYRFVATGTVEEKILQLHATKRDLVESLLAGGPRAATLSIDELASLLGESPYHRDDQLSQ